KVLIESLPEFVNPKNFNYEKAPKLEIAIGLESSNPVVLDKSVNKRLRWPHFVKVCKLARDNGAEVKAYILLKPPYLSEKESIDDAVKSAIDAAPHVDKISINPVNVQKNTVVEKLWFRNEWVAPWLWSVVDVLKKCEDLPIRVYSDPTGGGTRRGAHNCHDCNKKILQALNNHRLGLGDLKGLHCNCKSRWDVLVQQSNLRRNGSEPHGYRSGFSGSRHF
ncbi:MAG: TIGR01210 family radical SAM protein, partial [Candidatus Thermoplasmatota archaeon]|nr:TIGR01210 family radical SAM protein [Candidatus Thermoplasmatota archaeon]